MSRMERLYARLGALGINRSYARGVALPAGWNDRDADENPAVYAQALSLLSRHLNLELRALQSEDAPLAWQDCGAARFKHAEGAREAELDVARCLAARAAQIACDGVTTPVSTLPSSGGAIRAAIQATGDYCITLPSVLDYCWDQGIPVLPVTRLPVRAQKPDAFAGIFRERPAIVICKKPRYAAWLLFVLAHELGHLVLRHIDEADLLVDARIDPADRNAQEEDANTFAVELLTGKADVRYQARYNLTAEELAQAARTAGERDGVDAGIIALNYAQNTRRSQEINLALDLLEPVGDPMQALRVRLRDRLDWDELPRESRQYLRRIMETDAVR